MLTRFFQYGLVLWLTAFPLLMAPNAYADEVNKEYLVKAAFIYNFVKFVEWPAEKAIPSQSNIDICVLGDSPMSRTSAVFKQASTSKLSLTLTSETSAAHACSHCHIVFISKSEADDLDGVLANFKNQPVLTVSDMDGFAEHGGMIGFTTEDGKIKLVINPKPAVAAGLHIDAQLLEIALKVIH